MCVPALEMADKEKIRPDNPVNIERIRVRDRVANAVGWTTEAAGDALRLGLRTGGELIGSTLRGTGEGIWYGLKRLFARRLGTKQPA